MTNFADDLAPWPTEEYEAFGAVERRPVGKMQRLVGRFLGRNWARIPHVTHHDDIDIMVIEDRRKAWNAANPDRKITPLSPVVKALGLALREFPQFNVSLSDAGDELAVKSYCHVGVAVEVPNGLLVPVLRDCAEKAVSQIAAELAEISAKARTKGLSMQEMTGGSITISSLGHIGGTAFTPIVNAPQVAILGVTKAYSKPMPAADGGVEWRTHLPLSLSYDHRVINGADAARFVVALGNLLNGLELD
jgi:pyruvate dehydrogenase E2 component (dihydrolipoamide acetyltransferase)